MYIEDFVNYFDFGCHWVEGGRLKLDDYCNANLDIIENTEFEDAWQVADALDCVYRSYIDDYFKIPPDGSYEDFLKEKGDTLDKFDREILECIVDPSKIVFWYTSIGFLEAHYAYKTNYEMTLKEFEEFKDLNHYTEWDYPLEEYEHINENKLKVAVVDFADCVRFCER